MSATLHVIHNTSLVDVPSVLRNIADAIERGEYGTVLSGALVLDAEAIEVFHMGEGEAAPNAHLLLHMGAAKMVKAVMGAKGS